MKKLNKRNLKKISTMNKNQIKKNISEIRNSLNLTQAEMAEKIGISRQAYINLENWKTAPINKQITKMAENCGISEDKILFGYSHAEMQASQLREAGDLKEQIEEMKLEHQKEVDVLSDKLDTLTQLIFSERQHVRTQGLLINEQQAMITKLSKENMDLRHELKKRR